MSKEDHKLLTEEDVLNDIFYEPKDLWKGKYKVSWCSLCDRAIIACPVNGCNATSCNCRGCKACIDDTTEFNKSVKIGVEDYLSEKEILAYYKAKRIQHFIVLSIKMGDSEIDWDKMKAEGWLCKNDYKVFGFRDEED